MSQKIRILKRFALFLCILMLSVNCTNDENLEKQSGNSSAKLKEAQNNRTGKITAGKRL